MSNAKIAGFVIGFFVLIAGVWAISMGVRYATAPVKGAVNAREQIQSAASRISAYNTFFDQCAAIQGLKDQLAAQKTLKPVNPDDKERIESNIAGIQGAISQAVAQYNADAAKSYTIGQFRSSQLPYQLNTRGDTVCVV